MLSEIRQHWMQHIFSQGNDFIVKLYKTSLWISDCKYDLVDQINFHKTAHNLATYNQM